MASFAEFVAEQSLVHLWEWTTLSFLHKSTSGIDFFLGVYFGLLFFIWKCYNKIGA